MSFLGLTRASHIEPLFSTPQADRTTVLKKGEGGCSAAAVAQQLMLLRHAGAYGRESLNQHPSLGGTPNLRRSACYIERLFFLNPAAHITAVLVEHSGVAVID